MVSVATGPVAYRIYAGRPQPGVTPPDPDRILLAQLITDEQLMIEAFPGGAVKPVEFTVNAMFYLR